MERDNYSAHFMNTTSLFDKNDEDCLSTSENGNKFTSALECFAKNYDKRFRKLMDNGEIFDPILNRYDSIIRYVVYRIQKCHRDSINFLYPYRRHVNTKDGSFNIINLGSKFGYGVVGRVSARKMLMAGINFVNNSNKYTYSTRTMEVYNFDEWTDFIYELIEAGYISKINDRLSPNAMTFRLFKMSSKLRFKESMLEDNPSVIEDAKLYSRLHNLYYETLRNIANESFKNISSWVPGEGSQFGQEIPEWHRDFVRKEQFSISSEEFNKLGLSRDGVLSHLREVNQQSLDSYVERLVEFLENNPQLDFSNLKETISSIPVPSQIIDLFCYCLVYAGSKYYSYVHIPYSRKLAYQRMKEQREAYGENKFSREDISEFNSMNNMMDSINKVEKDRKSIESAEEDRKSRESVEEDRKSRESEEIVEKLKLENEQLKSDNGELREAVLAFKDVTNTFISSLSTLQEQLDKLSKL